MPSASATRPCSSWPRAPYLVTDPLGVILDANLRTVLLLGVGGRFVAGKPLASFVASTTGNRMRGVLAAPVGLAGSVLGTINAVTSQPRTWTEDDAGAITALAAVVGRLLARPTRPATAATWSSSCRGRWTRGSWSSRPRAC